VAWPRRETLEASLAALVDAALIPFDVPAQERALAGAMIDLDTWQAMRRAGFDTPAAVAAISEMLMARYIKFF
jgi:hypothetical protein